MSVERQRLLALLAVGLFPWSVLIGPAGVDLVFLWGLANPATGHVVSLPAYLFVYTAGLPDRLLAWPTSTVLYLGGLAAAVAQRWDRGDTRLTAGTVGLAGLAHLAFAVGVARRGSVTVVPVGTVLVALVLWWFCWPPTRRSHGRPPMAGDDGDSSPTDGRER